MTCGDYEYVLMADGGAEITAYFGEGGEILIPEDNLPDLDEIDPNVRNALQFIAVSHMDRVLETALCPKQKDAAITAEETAPLMPKEENGLGASISQ